MKQLNILDLHRSMNDKKSKTVQCYDKVLDICHKKIQSCANSKQVRCVFEVPCFIFGYPIFDYSKCLEYVYESLVKNGFLVKYYFPKHLYVSWDFQEIESSKALSKRKTACIPALAKPASRATLSYKPSGKLCLDLD